MATNLVSPWNDYCCNDWNAYMLPPGTISVLPQVLQETGLDDVARLASGLVRPVCRSVDPLPCLYLRVNSATRLGMRARRWSIYEGLKGPHSSSTPCSPWGGRPNVGKGMPLCSCKGSSLHRGPSLLQEALHLWHGPQD